MKWGWMKAIGAGMLVSAVLAGCGGSGNGDDSVDSSASQKPTVDTTPVTLKVWLQLTLTDNDLNVLVINPVKKKYPFISFDFNKEPNVDKVIASDSVPDLIFSTNGFKGDMVDRGLLTDITPLIKKFNIDMSRYESYIVDGFKNDKGELLALPYSINSSVMLYNKDIFDKFGVAYPKDGITWEQAIDLGKSLTRMDQNVQYRGIDPESVVRLSSVLSLTPVDKKTNKSIVADNASYKKVFELLRSAYSIPGNMPSNLIQGTLNIEKDFMGTKTIAMFPTVSNTMTRIAEATRSGLNWDIAQYPSYPDKPGVGMFLDAHGAYITKNSMHKDQALLVAETMSSPEVQADSTRKLLRITTLSNKAIKDQFGADVDFIKNKNVQAIYKTKAAQAPDTTKFHNPANNVLMKKFQDYMQDKVDLNTALKQADEEINKLVEAGSAK